MEVVKDTMNKRIRRVRPGIVVVRVESKCLFCCSLGFSLYTSDWQVEWKRKVCLLKNENGELEMVC